MVVPPDGSFVRHKRFSDFVTDERPYGLNSDMETVWAVCQAVPEAAAALNRWYEVVEDRVDAPG